MSSTTLLAKPRSCLSTSCCIACTVASSLSTSAVMDVSSSMARNKSVRACSCLPRWILHCPRRNKAFTQSLSISIKTSVHLRSASIHCPNFISTRAQFSSNGCWHFHTISFRLAAALSLRPVPKSSASNTSIKEDPRSYKSKALWKRPFLYIVLPRNRKSLALANRSWNSRPNLSSLLPSTEISSIRQWRSRPVSCSGSSSATACSPKPCTSRMSPMRILRVVTSSAQGMLSLPKINVFNFASSPSPIRTVIAVPESGDRPKRSSTCLTNLCLTQESQTRVAHAGTTAI
mmetsp:Transcript_47811/g.107319  ORF Transcript_47811/g.107319 Transcript_47811/m.107319 type:complete len:289 (+) Transcript_47811:131-997(+)